jgi:hypothetical protein
VIDPFRGAAHEEDPERFASRSVDAQPLDDVIATLERLPDVRIVRSGRRFTVGRGHEVAKVSFASAARTVSLDDATFEGDGALLLAMLHALLPLFGAVEITIGNHRELVDGHEPLDPILKRYETWWIDESLKLAKKLSKPEPKPKSVGKKIVNRGPNVEQRRALLFLVFLLMIIAAALWSANR